MMRDNKPIQCAKCAEHFDPDACGGWVQGIGDCCESCYYEETFECCACGERDSLDQQRTMLVVGGDVHVLGGGVARHGIYCIKRCPYHLAPMIGEGSLFSDALEFLQPLPPGLDFDDYPCGHLCGSCQKIVTEYQGKTLRQIIRFRVGLLRREQHSRCRTPKRFRVGSRVLYREKPCVVIGHSTNGAGFTGAYVVEVRDGVVGIDTIWVGNEIELAPAPERKGGA